MGSALSKGRLRAVATAVAVVAVAGVGAGCSAKENDADLVAGKKLFVQKCGSCHVLNRAGTKGTTGPDLDQAFHQSQKEGFGESAIRGVIRKQIEYPARGGVMPAGLVNSGQADDIAAYVAKVVAKRGKDTGLLATAVPQAGAGKPAVAQNGLLSIAADATGQLAFVSKLASAQAGKLTVEMPNKSGTPHNIVIDGKGKGAVVNNGVSKFTASFAAGKYTFYCAVPGHRQAGMQGVLTVK
jgi:mono/diheme cytochrome c family protein